MKINTISKFLLYLFVFLDIERIFDSTNEDFSLNQNFLLYTFLRKDPLFNWLLSKGADFFHLQQTNSSTKFPN